MKKETVCFSFAFVSVICGLVGATVYAGHPLGLGIGIVCAILGTILLGLGLSGVFDALSKQHAEQCAVEVKRIEEMQKMFENLQASVKSYNSLILDAQQKSHADLEHLSDQLTAICTMAQNNCESSQRRYKALADETRKQEQGFQERVIEELVALNKLLANIEDSTRLISKLESLIETNHKNNQALQKKLADENRKNEQEFQEGVIEELAALNTLSTSVQDATSSILNEVEEISSAVTVIEAKYPDIIEKIKKIEYAIKDGDEELSNAFEALKQVIADHMTTYQNVIQKYSDVTEQDVQLIKELLEDPNE